MFPVNYKKDTNITLRGLNQNRRNIYDYIYMYILKEFRKLLELQFLGIS